MINECKKIDGMKIGRETQNTLRKPSPGLLFPPQNPHDLT
jgi:hypothetical protein